MMARFQWRKFLIIFLVVAGGCYFSVWGLMAWLYPAPVPCEKSADKNVQQTLDEVYPKTKNIEIVGHLGGEVESVVIRGNRAIVDIGPELAIFDISDPADLKRIGYILLPGKLIFVSPDGVYAIILYEGSRDEGYGLWKVALTDPENMTAIHLFSPGGSIDDIRIRDTKAQMIVSRCKLYGSPLGFLEGSFDRCKQSFQIIDFSLDTFKPTSACYPTILGRAVSFFANVGLTEPDYKVATDDQFAFSASGVHGLQVFDFSDPSNPSLINTYPSPTFVDNLEVFDNFVYMNRRLVPEIGSPREYYLDVYDISNPREPVLVNSVPKLYYFYTIVDNIAFTRIGKSNYEFKTIDLSQPKNLSEVIIPDYLRVSDLKIINGYAYLIDEGTFLGTRVLKILDLRVAASPREIF
ncbi:MAG: hypothetical protein HUU38_29350, partial [Anaerolineales bacterium]|nr:hypothetical protein [Anaerolineales bacterium]